MKLIIGLLTLIAAQNTFAQNATPTALEKSMSTIKSYYNPIVKNISDPSYNKTSADLAGKIADEFGNALKLTPKIFATMPGEQQAAALASYQGLIQKEIDASLALQKALLANDNATALHITDEMSATKSQGHKLFNP